MSLQHPDLAGFPVVLEIPVQWGEMDAYGHVNNTVLFRYFESARIAFLDAIGMLETMERDRIGAILASTSCRFRRPLFHPDTALVGGRASEIREDRFTMEYRVVSRAQDTLAANGDGVIVCYDYKAGSKCALPDAVREGLERVGGERRRPEGR